MPASVSALAFAALLVPAVAPPSTLEPVTAACRNAAYLVQGKELLRFDEHAVMHEPVARLDVGVNALAYVPDEELFYGIAGQARVVTLDARGTVTDRGAAPAGLHGAYAAAARGNNWIVHSGTEILTVRVPELAIVNRVGLPDGVDVGDWDISPFDGRLYGITAGRPARLVGIDPTTGETTVVAPLPELPPGSSFGAVVVDPFGVLHALHNATGDIYHVPIDHPAGLTVTRSHLTAYHADFAACPAAWDFGDAPDALGKGGARHTITTFGTLVLGTSVDEEPDSTVDDGDDGIAGALVVDAEATVLTVQVAVRNSTGQPALLAGWHDLDHDGRFTAAERATAEVPAGTDSATLHWGQIAIGTGSDHSQLRLRLYGSVPAIPAVPADPVPDGPASGGEVEDHPIRVRWPQPRPGPPLPAPPPPSLVPPPFAPPPPVAPPSPSPSLSPPTPPPRVPGTHQPAKPAPARLPLTWSFFAGMLVPAITVAARVGARRGAR